MQIIIVEDYQEMSQKAASILAEQIKSKPQSVLGLATGSTPEGMYKNLINKNLDWSQVKTYNLDEYIGVKQNHPMSYHSYMNEKLFKFINIDLKNTNVPIGTGDILKNGKDYDVSIDKDGGIDLQILGIGENAHIGFNEPGSSRETFTGQVNLTDSTIQANSRYFESKDDVPKLAITMGIGSILKAKKIVLLASGTKKAEAIFKTINTKPNINVPSSFLQEHNDVTLIIDKESANLINN